MGAGGLWEAERLPAPTSQQLVWEDVRAAAVLGWQRLMGPDVRLGSEGSLETGRFKPSPAPCG